MFQVSEGNVQFPRLEQEVLDFWKERQIYAQSLQRRAGAPPYVFFEGPPTANGMPHPGHCLTRAIKDLFPRYKTMRGYRCDRKAGWDTHGLPVEVEVCKEMGIHSKEEIENFGVEPFIHRCQASVWRYMQEWERLTDRLGFWIDLQEAYVTYHQSYVESVWWALKNLFDRGLLYQGHKIVWWWAQGGTALSAGEVGLGYREVADPSVYVRFPLLDAGDQPTSTSLLVWTTTPWTLPSNQFVAVDPKLEYSEVHDPEQGDNLVLASALVATVAGKVKRELTVVRTMSGESFVGKSYLPPFDCYVTQGQGSPGKLKTGESEPRSWRVVPGTFVTTETGTGLVHLAPAFGEDDFKVLVAEQDRYQPGQGPELICAVGPDGKFTDAFPEYQGRWVKEADKDLTRRLKHEGKLYHQEQYLHQYPFCWRADQDPLIQYPRKSWFVRTTQFRDEMLANNRQVNWLPEHIRDGRFGNFLESNVDWALSRERYWGTPLPIWVCEATGQMEAVGSYAELLAKTDVQGTEVWDAAKKLKPDLVEDLKIHKPYIDAVTYASPFAEGQRMRRVSEVIDCWFDSGAMPFAQWGYPHQNQERFQAQFPADFISEAVDQTRGWFYSLLAISTMLFGDRRSADKDRATREWPHPFRNCIVLGLMLGEDGTKMSKSKGNYLPPNIIFDRYGADALRWYFFANQAPWTTIQYREQAIRDSIPQFLLRLWNVQSFFSIYANIDRFDPASELAGPLGDLPQEVLKTAKTYRPVSERAELDRWLLSELARTVQAVVSYMDAYDNFAACKELTEFVDGLSNWYVRRSRDRYWSGQPGADKADAYWTLYECLVTLTKLIAPFVPFLAETLWKNLVRVPFGKRALESVHWADFPRPLPEFVDGVLSQRMAVLRDLVSLGRAARTEAKLKVRQPLAKVEIILARADEQDWLESQSDLIADELNVKAVEFTTHAEHYIDYTVLPDLKKLGPKLGKQLPAVRKALTSADPAKLMDEKQRTGQVTLALPDGNVVLGEDDLLIRMQAKPGWAASQGPAGVVVLATEVTPELAAEGLVRELTHVLQGRRKELGCEYTERIELGIVTDAEEMQSAVAQFGPYLKGETLAESLAAAPLAGVEPWEVNVAGHNVQVYVRRVPA